MEPDPGHAVDEGDLLPDHDDGAVGAVAVEGRHHIAVDRVAVGNALRRPRVALRTGCVIC